MQSNEDEGFAGKVAVVAGGGAAGDGIGNGRAAAILLARAGARVVVIDQVLALAERTVEMIAADGGAAIAIGADLTDDNQCRRMVDETMDRLGRLDFWLLRHSCPSHAETALTAGFHDEIKQEAE